MPKAVTKTVSRARRPAAEVEREFKEIRQEVGAAQEAASAKADAMERLRETEVRTAVEGVTVESVVERISGLGVEIARALGGLSEKLVREVELLGSVREAVEIERAELARLHKIDVASTALDQLVQDYGREKERLETEIAQTRAQWEEESRTSERERREQEEALKKQRQRETDDYEYKKVLERKKAQDKYEEEARLLERKNHEKQEALERDWQTREAALKEREEELARLRQESAGFATRLQDAAATAAAQASRETTSKFEQEVLVLRKDREAEQRLAEMQIRALEEAASRQTAQIAALQAQLEEAKRQVQDIALKAIEGASGARALAHVNQIAMEQAKPRGPQG